VWTGFIWLRIGTSSKLLWTVLWTFRFHKRQGISWLTTSFWRKTLLHGVSYYKSACLVPTFINTHITIMMYKPYCHSYLCGYILHPLPLTSWPPFHFTSCTKSTTHSTAWLSNHNKALCTCEPKANAFMYTVCFLDNAPHFLTCTIYTEPCGTTCMNATWTTVGMCPSYSYRAVTHPTHI